MTNVAVVRLKKQGNRFEIACYKNKVRRILDKGAGKERESQLSSQFRDIATIVVMQKTINSETQRPYTISMVDLARNPFCCNSKKQALDVIRELQKQFPIKRSPMRLRLTLPLQNFPSLLEKLKEWEACVVSKDESGTQCEMEPGLFRECDSFVRNLQGRLEILAVSVHAEGDTSMDHYDEHDDMSLEITKPPRIQSLNLARNWRSKRWESKEEEKGKRQSVALVTRLLEMLSNIENTSRLIGTNTT